MSRTVVCIAALAGLALGLTSVARAQTVTVQGQADEYGQPQGPAQPPPGYGQQQPYQQQQPYPQQQPYQQPYAQQPYQQAPTYAPAQRQVRYEDRQTSVKALWIPGIIVVGVAWGLTSTFGAFSSDVDFNTWCLVPLIGPWVALTFANDEDETVGAVVGGIAQVAGLAMFVLGLTLNRTVSVPVYSFDRDDERSPQLAVDLRPAPGGGQVGLALSHF